MVLESFTLQERSEEKRLYKITDRVDAGGTNSAPGSIPIDQSLPIDGISIDH